MTTAIERKTEYAKTDGTCFRMKVWKKEDTVHLSVSAERFDLEGGYDTIRQAEQLIRSVREQVSCEADLDTVMDSQVHLTLRTVAKIPAKDCSYGCLMRVLWELKGLCAQFFLGLEQPLC